MPLRGACEFQTDLNVAELLTCDRYRT